MQNANRYVLVIRRGPQKGKGFTLSGALETLGRYAGNTITIPDETVSRHHARMRQTGDGYTVEDLNSANGLFVNGERITAPRALKSGDVVRLGDVVEMLYEKIDVDTDATPVVPAFDEKGRPGVTRRVSDTGGTVWMKKVAAPPGREEPKSGPFGKAWVWIAILVAVIVIGAVVYFVQFAGH